MLPTTDVIKYMIAHRDERGRIATAFDDPVMLQAELDGFATRMDGYWRGHGIIEVGERRTVRHMYGEPPTTEIVGTEEIRARCTAELAAGDEESSGAS